MGGLKVIIDADQVLNVKLSRGKLNVTLKHDLSNNIDDRALKAKPLIDKWYQHKAKAIFHERLTELLPKATWVTRYPFVSCNGNENTMGKLLYQRQPNTQPHLVKHPKNALIT